MAKQIERHQISEGVHIFKQSNSNRGKSIESILPAKAKDLCH